MSYVEPTTSSSSAFRVMHLIFAGAVAFALIGLFVGMRQGKTIPPIVKVQPAAVVPGDDAIPAMSYREYDRREFGVNRNWRNTLANLAPASDEFNVVPRSEEERLQAMQKRASRRAFDGAPPMIPHPIDQMATASCVACHGEGLAVGKGVHAPRMSHAFMHNCTQCHAEMKATELDPFVLAENIFEGRPAPASGQRAWSGAPPTIPHSTHMRENCLSCHGPSGSVAIRTTHPWRANCLQCHAPSASFDQVRRDDTQPQVPAQ